MIKMKGILAVGVILLFVGLAFSPVTAQTTDQIKIASVGDIETVQLSETDQATMEKLLPTLLEKMQTATSFRELVNTVQTLMKEYGRHPILILILTLLIKFIQLNYKFHQLLPVRKTAFVMSMGFTNKFLSFGKNKINIIRPMTTWFYSGRSNMVLDSRTIILDPYPFSIRTLTGRQIGLMTHFVGLYIHFSGSISDKTQTFFVGYAQTIRGFDLSPIHN